MNLVTIRRTLLWCFVLNYLLIIVWFLLVYFAHDAMFDWVRNWGGIDRHEFDLVNYAGISLYKIGNLLLCLVPCIALYLVRPSTT